MALLLPLAACGGSSSGGNSSGGGGGGSDYASDATIEKCYGDGELDSFGTSRAGYGADISVTNSGNEAADYAVTVVFEKGSEQLASMTGNLQGVAPGQSANTNVTPLKYMTTFSCRITNVERS